MLIILSSKSYKWNSLERKRKKEGRDLGERGRGASVLLYRHTVLPYMFLLKLLRLPGQFLQGNTKQQRYGCQKSIGQWFVCMSVHMWERQTNRWEYGSDLVLDKNWYSCKWSGWFKGLGSAKPKNTVLLYQSKWQYRTTSQQLLVHCH